MYGVTTCRWGTAHNRSERGVTMARWQNIILTTVLVLAAPGCGVFGSAGTDHLRLAEEYTRQGDIAGAIDRYTRHIAYRNSIEDRPEWENPHFYELMIGDLELRRNDLAAALAAYERAERAGIEPGLVSDRYRSTGSWLEQNGRLGEALTLLRRYRDRDPLLFDAMLDRIARAVTAAEDIRGSSPADITDKTAPPSDS